MNDTPTIYAPEVLAKYENQLRNLVRELPGSGNVHLPTGHRTLGDVINDLTAVRDFQVGMVERYEADRAELIRLQADLRAMRRLLNG